MPCPAPHPTSTKISSASPSSCSPSPTQSCVPQASSPLAYSVALKPINKSKTTSLWMSRWVVIYPGVLGLCPDRLVGPFRTIMFSASQTYLISARLAPITSHSTHFSYRTPRGQTHSKRFSLVSHTWPANNIHQIRPHNFSWCPSEAARSGEGQ